MPTKGETVAGYQGSWEEYLEYRAQRKEVIDKETREVEAEVRAFEARQCTESGTNKTVYQHFLNASITTELTTLNRTSVVPLDLWSPLEPMPPSSPRLARTTSPRPRNSLPQT